MGLQLCNLLTCSSSFVLQDRLTPWPWEPLRDPSPLPLPPPPHSPHTAQGHGRWVTLYRVTRVSNHTRYTAIGITSTVSMPLILSITLLEFNIRYTCDNRYKIFFFFYSRCHRDVSYQNRLGGQYAITNQLEWLLFIVVISLQPLWPVFYYHYIEHAVSIYIIITNIICRYANYPHFYSCIHNYSQ